MDEPFGELKRVGVGLDLVIFGAPIQRLANVMTYRVPFVQDLQSEPSGQTPLGVRVHRDGQSESAEGRRRIRF
jgi:hypothetical protein